MDAFLLDLKYGVRSLWHGKGFALTVLLTFSVCIAANSALFAIVNSVILRPLPVSGANSILILSNRIPESRSHGVQQQQFRRLLRPPSRSDGFREPGDVPRAQSNRGAEWFAAADSQYAGYAVLVQTTPCFPRARPPFPRRRGRSRQRSEGDPQSRTLA